MGHAREFAVSSRLQQVIDLFSRAGARPHPDTPTPAAGIVLLRDAADGLEVYVTRSKDDPGLPDPNRWAFPTRQAQAADSVHMPLGVWHSEDCARALRIDNQSRALAWFTAAARVALMRLGIVLADRPGSHVVTSLDLPWLDDAREAVAGRRQKFPQVIRGQNLNLRLDLLHPWLRWVNSDWQLRRFDTVYFVAVLPPGQQVKFRASLDSWGGWMRPADVLERADSAAQQAGAVPNEFISIPTRLLCESLSDEYTAGAAMLRVRDLAPVRSALVWRRGRPVITLDPQAQGIERAGADGTGFADEPLADESATGLTGGSDFADDFEDEESGGQDDTADAAEEETDDAPSVEE